MSGLMDSLSMAARALEAQRFGLDVTGQNIANVNTPGYRHREALFASVPGTDNKSAGGGVEVVGLRANRDERLDQRLLQERPAEQREGAVASSLAVVETTLGRAGESIDGALSSFFDALSGLTSDPTSAIARQDTASAGDALAHSFQDMAARLGTARTDADQGIRSAVDQINTLTTRLSGLNGSLASLAPGSSQSLQVRDDVSEVLNELSGLVAIQTITRADGGADVSLSSGRPLVVGANTYAIGVTSTAPAGLAALTSQGVDITAEVKDGSVGGLLKVRDTLVPGYLTQLDTLAYTVSTSVNTIHQAGYNLAGATGQAFFAPLASATGAASAIAMSAAVLADPSKIAAGATAVVGDNDTARALADLRNTKTMSSGSATFADAWGQLVYRVGADSKSATDNHDSRSEIVRQVNLLRDQVSGVSLDEEAMMMMKFQRAYEANARYFQSIDATLDTLMSLAG